MIGLSCSETTVPNIGNSTDLFTEILNPDRISLQFFEIENAQGGEIQGAKGTIITIPENAFVDSLGQIATGKITIELKEALTLSDMIRGNLTTTSDHLPLQTGGMIYLGAKQNETLLALSNEASVIVSIPSDTIIPGMSVFQGQVNNTSINWINPDTLFGPKRIQSDSVIQEIVVTEMTTNVKVGINKLDHYSEAPMDLQYKLSDIIWNGSGLKLKKDSFFTLDSFEIRFTPQDSTISSITIDTIQKGVNTFYEDQATSYIFRMKNLGWANIDKLLSDPRTEEVNLLAQVSNHNEFELVYITLITSSMYLPGYQKKDNSFSFSHGDFEKQSFPIGASAQILATAYKDNKPFYAISPKFEFKKEQTISLTMIPTTKDSLDYQIENKIIAGHKDFKS